MSDNQILRERAQAQSRNAYSPYSNAKIGSALETSDGKIFAGCNIENSSYGGTVCAERVAIWKAMSETGGMKIKKIYVYSEDGWPPCGMCRQVMSEFADPEMKVVIGNGKGHETEYKFSEIMPLSFTPNYLNK